MDIPEPTVRTTRYEVSCLPPDDVNAFHFTARVEYRGKDMWAVTNGWGCLGTDGEFDYEPSPSNREDDWLATHRFDLDTALRLAKEVAPKMTVNGYTLADILAKSAAKDGEYR